MISGLICRLAYNEEKDFFFYEPEPEKVEKAKPAFSVDMKSSLDLLDGIWLPVPFSASCCRIASTKVRPTGRACAW